MRLGPLLVLAAVVPVAGAAAGGRPGRVVRVEGARRVEVFVPAGSFAMGVTEEEAAAALTQCQLAYFPPNHTPRHQNAIGQLVDFCSEYYDGELFHMRPRQVFLDAYAIDRDEVSVADYRACVAQGGCTLDPLVAGDERYIRDAWPMVNATWEEAQAYCRWRGGRLPSEAEWERAARGDHGGAWPWGELEQPQDFNHGQARAVALREIERKASVVPLRFFGDPDGSDGAVLLAPPGSYPWGESPHGTRDQAGNVAEWTADAYLSDDEHRGYQGLPAANPLREGGATQKRVIRGGSWRQPSFLARPSLRDPFSPYYDAGQRYSHVGFRCARPLR